MDWPRLRRGLEYDEGKRLRPYYCTAKKVTIAIGHNLTDQDLPEEVIKYLFKLDINEAIKTCMRLFTRWDILNDNKQYVLCNMAFQLGYHNLKGFKKFVKAVNDDDWETAFIEMLDSKWARSDSPKRAHRLAAIITK